MHRPIYVGGFLALVVAALSAFFSGAPTHLPPSGGKGWFGEAVYMACAYLGIVFAALWAWSDWALRSFSWRWLPTMLLVVAIGAVVEPSLSLVAAAVFGASRADFQTWHLLPLFAALHQLLAVVLLGGLAGGVLLVTTIVQLALAEGSRPPKRFVRPARPRREEIAFIESIDACFPYGDQVAARAVIHEGAAISDNAALMVAHELAFAPDQIPASLRLSLLDLLAQQRPSVLVLAAKAVVHSLILGEQPSNEAAELLLRASRVEPISFNALSILAECSPEHARFAESIRRR